MKRFNATLTDSMGRLQGGYSRLGDTWRDQQHQKFTQEYEQAVRVLQQFMRSSEQEIALLQKLAQRSRDYLDQR